jgi:hypothetical protein
VLVILSILASVAAPPVSPPYGGTNKWDGYPVFAYRYEGRCGYEVTDIVGITSKQLEDTLAGGYRPSEGLQIIVDPDTPVACVSEARRIGLKLGFKKIRTRLATGADRSRVRP